MREDVLSLKAMGGDPVSEEYLKADLYHRAEALKDIPDAPLFFGRLDYAGDVTDTEDGVAGHSFHIGRRHVHAPDGTPAVIDWRAPVSRPFYRASGAEPMNLELRRRFGFSGGELTAYEDELFTTDRSVMPKEHQPSQILIDEIERPRSGPMRDIVATIQPDQDDIVRADAGQTVCVQGAPGTGKTAVGLHRVAYLLYATASRSGAAGVVMVGPNRAFLSYISNVLPALGEIDVTQATVAELVRTGSVPVRAADSEAAASQGRRADGRGAGRACGPPRGSRRGPGRAARIPPLAGPGLPAAGAGGRAEHPRRALRRGPRTARAPHRARGPDPDGGGRGGLRRPHPRGGAALPAGARRGGRDLAEDRSGPAGVRAAVVAARAGRGGRRGAQRRGTAGDPVAAAPRGPGSARWSAADAVLVDEARDLITRTPSLAHVVVDEAQDLSPMECRALGRRCSTGAATVLGDLAQGTTPWAAPSWESLLSNLGKPDTSVRELSVGYRVPRQILDYASHLLAVIAPELRPASSLRANAGALDVVQVRASALGAEAAAAAARACTRPGSVAVIAADPQVASLAAALDAAGVAYGPPGSDARLTLVPVTLAKGLDFSTTSSWSSPRGSPGPSPAACSGCTWRSPGPCPRLNRCCTPMLSLPEALT